MGLERIEGDMGGFPFLLRNLLRILHEQTTPKAHSAARSDYSVEP